MTSLPAPDFRPVAAFPEVAQIEHAARASDWAAVRAIAIAASDALQLNFVINTVTDVFGVEYMLTKAMDEDDSTLPNLMLGARHIILAWEARSSLGSEHVSEAQWKTFRKHLVLAENLLMEVTAHEPDNVVAWKHRLTTARGLSLGLSESQRRYDQLAKVDPHFYPGQSNMLQELCPKWHGDWDKMFAFARQSAAAAPEGGLQGSLIAEAHLEKFLRLPDGEDRAYLAQPAVIEELADAGRRSVFHPSFEKRYGWLSAHSAFALCFSQAGDFTKAAAHFRAMGHLGSTSLWWGYLGSGAEQENFIKYRQIALQKG